VGRECLDVFRLECVPREAVKVVVPSEEEAARRGERDARDAAEDVVVAVCCELCVRADVEQAAGGVVRACGEGEAVGEERDRVDVGLVSLEGLDALARADVPVLCEGVAGARDERVLVRRDGDGHDVSVVVGELSDLLAGLDVPEDARHVARGSEDLAVAQETAAGNVPRVRVQLAAGLNRNLSRPEVVDAARVVKPSASNKTPVGTVAARHNPRTAQRNNMNLVRSKPIPHKQLAVLRRRNKMVRVRGPLHSIDLRKMALQSTAHFQLVVFANGPYIFAVLNKCRVARGFPVLPDLLLHLLNLLAHLLRLVLLVFL